MAPINPSLIIFLSAAALALGGELLAQLAANALLSVVAWPLGWVDAQLAAKALCAVVLWPGALAGALAELYAALPPSSSPTLVAVSCTSYGTVPRRVPPATIWFMGAHSNSYETSFDPTLQLIFLMIKGINFSTTALGSVRPVAGSKAPTLTKLPLASYPYQRRTIRYAVAV